MARTSNLQDSNQVFKRHKDSVLCCSIDSQGKLAVSGGVDDTAYVWSLQTTDVIFECEGHRESVVAASFSTSSRYVATGDLNGYIQVRSTANGNRVFDYEIDEINWLLWHSTSDIVLLAGTTKGEFWMWNINDPTAVKTFPTYGSPTTAARLFSDGLRIATVYGDGNVRVFELRTRQAVLQLPDTSSAEITSMDLNPNNALLAVGHIDSRVRIINVITGKVIGSLSCNSPDEKKTRVESSTGVNNSAETSASGSSVLKNDCEGDTKNDESEEVNAEPVEVVDEYTGCAESLDGEQEEDDEAEGSSEDELEELTTESVESVVFSPCGNYLAASNNCGSIYIWDIASQIIRCELHTGVGISRGIWSASNNYITGCLDGYVRIYNLNLECIRQIALHIDQILDVAYHSKYLLTASDDRTCSLLEEVN